MGRVMLCIGRYAKIPYFVEKVYVNVYSIEELCYCLIQNVYLIDKEIADEKLTDWLRKECGLDELAADLDKLLEEECSLGDFAENILHYAGYGSAEEIAQVKKELEKGSGLNAYEKKKARADYLAENKKYVLALKNYDILLEELPESEELIRAKVLHNRGVVYAGLFQFEHAAENFRLAFECDKARASYLCYLAAKRMGMDETEYLNFLAGQHQEYELSLQVETVIENVVKQFEGTEENRMLFTLKVCKEEGNVVSYYEEIERLTDQLKEQYREMVEA